MASAPVHTLPAARIAAAVRAGTLSPVAAVEACLARIERLDPRLRAWVEVDAPGALAQARALAADARAGRFRGPLHGVPVALKDIFDAAGFVTTSGAPAFAHRRPERDAPAVALLRRAGAVILGKTVTTPFAFADPSVTRNPWNLDHTPGGSSSGSAAAVAARMVPLALGSQTIGSTIRPAAYCGVVGFKGTWGRISAVGVTPLAWSLDHVGVFARTVEDAALLFAVLAASPLPGRKAAGARRRGGGAARASGGSGVARARVGPPRLGIPRRFVERFASPEVAAHLDQVASALSKAGARVGEVELPPSAAGIDDAGRLVLRAEAAAYHRRWFSEHAAEYPPRIRELVEAGGSVTAVAYLQAQEERARFRAEMSGVFERWDALLLPPAPAPAPPMAEGTTGDPVFCGPWTFAGLPAVALPSGLSRSGLPLGIQLVGPAGADDRLLAAASRCEAALDFEAAPPEDGASPAA